MEGAKASVIGGSAAAGVVFTRDVLDATRRDPRIAELEERIEAAEGAERQRLRAERASQLDTVRAEKMGELAAEVRLHPLHPARGRRRLGDSGIVARRACAPI